MKRLLVLIAVLMLAVLVLAACGGGGGEASQPSEQAPAATQPPAQAEEDREGEEAQAAAGDPAVGEQLYQASCAACHGMDARGIPGLGKDLRASEFVKGLSDQELLDFIKKGRDASDPANTTGVAMPPKGGNPALTDEDIMNIIAYIRSIEE